MNPKDHPNVGRKIKYVPTIITEDEITEGVITMYLPQGNIFKMDMLCINEVKHWIPARDCEFVK